MQRSRPASAAKSSTLIAGLLLLAGGAGIAIVKDCPQGALPFVILVLMAVGASLATFGLFQKTALGIRTKTLSAGGAGALLVLIFFAKPDVVAKVMCPSSHHLYFRVIKGTDETAPIGGALVRVMGYTTTTVTTNSLGESNYPFSSRDEGQEMRIWAEASGYKNSQPQPCVLDRLDHKITIPMQALGATSEVMIPTISETEYAKPIGLSARNYQKELDASKSDEVRAARIGEAAFANGDYRWAVKSLEQAKQNQTSGSWKSSAPYLIASYLKLGEREKARAEAEALKGDIKGSRGYLSNAPPLGFTARSAQTAANALDENDKAVLTDVANVAESYQQRAPKMAPNLWRSSAPPVR